MRQTIRRKVKRAPTITTRAKHTLSRQRISDNALKVLYRLRNAGYEALLVGGGVRDLLLRMRPKDFDVATDATPQEVASLFRNSRLIGRRFRLVHVFFQGEIIEVSTFRANTEEPKLEFGPEHSLVVRADNTYGTIEEDAWRRDFTVNSLYYNIDDFSIIDYTGGMKDLKRRVIRIIGDPWQRFHEDPVRLLRAIRLAAKLDFWIADVTEQCVYDLAHLLQHVPPARLFDEILKLFFEGNSVATYERLEEYGYIDALFPYVVDALQARENDQDDRMIQLALEATDERFAKKMSLNPGFLLSVLMWPLLQHLLEKEKDKHPHFFQTFHYSISEAMEIQSETVILPRRVTSMIRSIWVLQFQLIKLRGRRIKRVMSHRYFRAAYDFLLLRVAAGEPFEKEAEWWTKIQKATPEQRDKMISKL